MVGNEKKNNKNRGKEERKWRLNLSVDGEGGNAGKRKEEKWKREGISWAVGEEREKRKKRKKRKKMEI